MDRSDDVLAQARTLAYREAARIVREMAKGELGIVCGHTLAEAADRIEAEARAQAVPEADARFIAAAREAVPACRGWRPMPADRLPEWLERALNPGEPIVTPFMHHDRMRVAAAVLDGMAREIDNANETGEDRCDTLADRCRSLAAQLRAR